MGERKTSTEQSLNVNSPANLNSVLGAASAYCKEFYNGLSFTCPVIVTKYIQSKHRVRVRPIVKFGYLNEKCECDFLSREEFEVPIRVVSHGGFTLDWPYYVGDTGWVISSDFDLTMSDKNKRILGDDLSEPEIRQMLSPPDSFLVHELSSGFFIADDWSVEEYVLDSDDYDDSDSTDEEEDTVFSKTDKIYADAFFGSNGFKSDKRTIANVIEGRGVSFGFRSAGRFSLFSSVGDDDIYDESFKAYLNSNTCGISLDDDKIRILADGMMRYQDDKNYSYDLKQVEISVDGIAINTLRAIKENSEHRLIESDTTVRDYGIDISMREQISKDDKLAESKARTYDIANNLFTLSTVKREKIGTAEEHKEETGLSLNTLVEGSPIDVKSEETITNVPKNYVVQRNTTRLESECGKLMRLNIEEAKTSEKVKNGVVSYLTDFRRKVIEYRDGTFQLNSYDQIDDMRMTSISGYCDSTETKVRIEAERDYINTKEQKDNRRGGLVSLSAGSINFSLRDGDEKDYGSGITLTGSKTLDVNGAINITGNVSCIGYCHLRDKEE